MKEAGDGTTTATVLAESLLKEINKKNDYNTRSVKEGIKSGLAKINGWDNLSIHEKVEFDLNYLKEKSFRFDIYIIWLTALKVLKRVNISH